MAQNMEDVDSKELKSALIIDTTTNYPACGHDEAIMGDKAPGGGFYEICCQCRIVFVDPTP